MLKLWKYTVFRVKTVFKNYNVVERSEKVLEFEKRAPPRHPGTEMKFQVLIKDNPRIKEELKKKDLDLLNRLKIVKVTSKEVSEDSNADKRPLPQERGMAEEPQFGYNEPKIVSEGKCTLRQAMEFITNHQNNPNTHSVEAIAKAYSMKASDVENIIAHFRAFELFISRDGKQTVGKDLLVRLGVGKVVRPMFHKKFAHLEGRNLDEASISEEKK